MRSSEMFGLGGRSGCPPSPPEPVSTSLTVLNNTRNGIQQTFPCPSFVPLANHVSTACSQALHLLLPQGPGSLTSPQREDLTGITQYALILTRVSTEWKADSSPSQVTKESVWEKPRELKTALELEMDNTQWTEYATGGRPYWVHKQSKETTWDMPQEIKGQLSTARMDLREKARSADWIPSTAAILDRAQYAT